MQLSSHLTINSYAHLRIFTFPEIETSTQGYLVYDYALIDSLIRCLTLFLIERIAIGVYWLTGRPNDQLIGWLTDWRLVGGWSDGRTVGPANRRTVGRSVGSHGQSNDQSTVCQLINWLITKEKIQTARFFIFPYFCTNVELIGTPTLSSVVLAKDILFSFTLYAYLDSHKTQPWDKCPNSRKLGEYGQIWQLLGLLADLSWLLTCHCFQQKPVENPS